ncbi:hypothetical protein HHI36_002039 [Cryptolaemus montrouzieri]|uniref:Uncharacterized protein n=1 Tax=Cryptolaemus montrouzieri TaxID=559131 RepID=A0ABD2P997_9CUCU
MRPRWKVTRKPKPPRKPEVGLLRDVTIKQTARAHRERSAAAVCGIGVPHRTRYLWERSRVQSELLPSREYVLHFHIVIEYEVERRTTPFAVSIALCDEEKEKTMLGTWNQSEDTRIRGIPPFMHRIGVP